MNHSEFYTGLEFWCANRQYQCTDVGLRVIVAVRIDHADIATSSDHGMTVRTINRAEAEAIGWFNGPPYGVLESVFDENAVEGCELIKSESDTGD